MDHLFKMLAEHKVESELTAAEADDLVSRLYQLEGIVSRGGAAASERAVKVLEGALKPLSDEILARNAVAENDYDLSLLPLQRQLEERLQCLNTAMCDADCLYLPLKKTFDQVQGLMADAASDIKYLESELTQLKMRCMLFKCQRSQSLRMFHHELFEYARRRHGYKLPCAAYNFRPFSGNIVRALQLAGDTGVDLACFDATAALGKREVNVNAVANMISQLNVGGENVKPVVNVTVPGAENEKHAGGENVKPGSENVKPVGSSKPPPAPPLPFGIPNQRRLSHGAIILSTITNK